MIVSADALFTEHCIKALQMYLHLGMELIKVHRVIEFTQGDYMSEWVTYCTYMRSKARTEFEKQFWKLMVNVVGINQNIECEQI